MRGLRGFHRALILDLGGFELEDIQEMKAIAQRVEARKHHIVDAVPLSG